MKFDDPSEVEQLCYQMRLADFPRGENRARINELFNGYPPYTDEEVRQNGIAINVNFLESTRLAHDARSQFYNGFLKPGNYFRAHTDMGPKHRRLNRSNVVTTEMNRIMKRSLPYFESFRSRFASDVLHGVGPSAFRDSYRWCPQMIGVEDVMIPSNTLLTMENVPFFALYRSYTAPELIRLTRGPKSDPAWNKDLVEACIKWIDRETLALMGSNWPEVWSPEKAAERVKGDGGFYVGDQVPTIDVWDIYFWNDDNKQEGWNRKMILDSWSTPQIAGGQVNMTRKSGEPFEAARRQFLYDPGRRKFASKMTELVNFQFADLSSVAPFRYHSVRSLGFLLYAVCHLQNRLRCKFNESVFEALMMYFRVKSMDDVQRVLKVELYNRGFIDDTLQFVPANERFQVNANLVELGLSENSSLIQQNAGVFTANPQQGSTTEKEKTRFQVMAELNAMTSLVSSGLLQAYAYQTFEYREILRRFFIENSPDPDVVEFRARCLRQGVPEKMLKAEAWEIEPERVMGAGNKTLEMTIAEQLMAWRQFYDPEAQRSILRQATFSITDDPAMADTLVPEQPEVTDSIHDAQLRFGTLMMGGIVAPKSGTNHQDVIEALLGSAQQVVQRINATGGVANPAELNGLSNVSQHVTQEIAMLAEDQNERKNVQQYQRALTMINNQLKAFAQRLREQMKAGNGQGGMDQKEMAKIQGMQMQAQAKAQNTRESHAQRTAQRQIQFEMEQRREDAKAQREMQQAEAEHRRNLEMEHQRNQLESEAQTVKSAGEIAASRLKSMEERRNARRKPRET